MKHKLRTPIESTEFADDFGTPEKTTGVPQMKNPPPPPPRFIPKLFNTEMVNAIYAGTKEQTRRTKGLKEINNDPEIWVYGGWEDSTFEDPHATFIYPKGITRYVKPESKKGDIFWVRETWQDVPFIAPQKYHGYAYKADYWLEPVAWKWKPSIFMPKGACRLFLKVTNVRVERLQAILETDAKKEGAKQGIFREGPNKIKKEFQLELNNHALYFDGFKFIWMQINGRDSWDANPWVFVYDFEQIDRPKNFLK